MDAEFFNSKTMRDFQPAVNMDQFYENCSKLIKIIKGEQKVVEGHFEDNETIQLGTQTES